MTVNMVGLIADHAGKVYVCLSVCHLTGYKIMSSNLGSSTSDRRNCLLSSRMVVKPGSGNKPKPLVTKEMLGTIWRGSKRPGLPSDSVSVQ